MRVYNLKDLSGIQVGLLKAKQRVNPNSLEKANEAMWFCDCLGCGKETSINHKVLTSKKKLNCGCGVRKTHYNSGNKYGKLTILREGPKNSSNCRQVYCQCECGNESLVKTNNLISGNTTSCGCYGIESRKTHGMSNTRTYQIHEGMLRRCREDLKEEFPHHAGKGIKVCERWNPKFGGSFENFFEDMGEAPEGLSLDRIDCKEDYSKDNCRWATNSVQGYNKGLDPNNTSGKSGVSYYQLQQKWSAEIHVENKHIRLGMFENFEDAVKAREEAELKYYGWNKE